MLTLVRMATTLALALLELSAMPQGGPCTDISSEVPHRGCPISGWRPK
jgi:hypothetical protein